MFSVVRWAVIHGGFKLQTICIRVSTTKLWWSKSYMSTNNNSSLCLFYILNHLFPLSSQLTLQLNSHCLDCLQKKIKFKTYLSSIKHFNKPRLHDFDLLCRMLFPKLAKELLEHQTQKCGPAESQKKLVKTNKLHRQQTSLIMG